MLPPQILLRQNALGTYVMKGKEKKAHNDNKPKADKPAMTTRDWCLSNLSVANTIAGTPASNSENTRTAPSGLPSLQRLAFSTSKAGHLFSLPRVVQPQPPKWIYLIFLMLIINLSHVFLVVSHRSNIGLAYSSKDEPNATASAVRHSRRGSRSLSVSWKECHFFCKAGMMTLLYCGSARCLPTDSANVLRAS